MRTITRFISDDGREHETEAAARAADGQHAQNRFIADVATQLRITLNTQIPIAQASDIAEVLAKAVGRDAQLLDKLRAAASSVSRPGDAP